MSPLFLIRPTRPFAAFAKRSQRLTLLCAVALALFFPRVAFAAAPMCDPSGASIVAPAPALPNATGELVAPKGCDDTQRDGVDVSKTGPRVPLMKRVVDPPPRIAAPSSFVMSARAGVRMPRPDVAVDAARPGHSTEVFRPPRA